MDKQIERFYVTIFKYGNSSEAPMHIKVEGFTNNYNRKMGA